MQQKLAAKISLITLGVNLALAVVLMKFYAAAGLALASSLGGFLQLALYVRAFGARNFLAIISPKILCAIIVWTAILSFILEILKEKLYVYL